MPGNDDETAENARVAEILHFLVNLTQISPRESLFGTTTGIASGTTPPLHVATPEPATPVLSAITGDLFGDYQFGRAATAAPSPDPVSPHEGAIPRDAAALPIGAASFQILEPHGEAADPQAPAAPPAIGNDLFGDYQFGRAATAAPSPDPISPHEGPVLQDTASLPTGAASFQILEQHGEATDPQAPAALPPRASRQYSVTSRRNSVAPLSAIHGVRRPSAAPPVGEKTIDLIRKTVATFAERNQATATNERPLWPEVEKYGAHGNAKAMAAAFAPAAYLNALAVASHTARLTLLIRKAGPDTVLRLQTSRRTKGADIKAKTIKPASLKEFYGTEVSSLVKILRTHGLTGYAGVWSEEKKLKGVLLSKKAATREEYAAFVRFRDGEEDGQHDGRPYLPLDLPDSLDKQSLEAFRQLLAANPPPRALLEDEAYTGDLDLELIVRSRAVATQGSSDENFAKDAINAAIQAVDPRRDGGDALPVRHGSEKNYTAHRRNEQGDMGPTTSNTEPDARLLMVKQGVLSIVRQDEAQEILRKEGINDSRRSSDASLVQSRRPSVLSVPSRRPSYAP